MAEFKIVVDEINSEINAMSVAGDGINSAGKISVSVSGMKTAQEYIAEEKRIYDLLEKFKALVIKDAADYTEAVKLAVATDKSLAG